MSCLKKPFVGGATKQLPLRSVLLSSLSSSTVAALLLVSPFWRRRNKEKKAVGDDKPSSAHVIDHSDASDVAALCTSAGAMDDIERRLRIVVPEAIGVYGRHIPLSLQLLRGYVVALSVMLLVPLVVPLPSLAASVGTKSGSKRIFAAPDVNAFPLINDLFDPLLQILRSQQSRRVEVKLDEEVMK
ncbi:uncharacterized protein MONOS_8486 [Monocercomonoides exilis]|uniref:uncharacterized protein n=1 Tax=Monocercomonoides exilis TaxID=2049356 RepID=UPI003559D723|nr:hypothetical protein MONOS_8486 [Monocercomonoides exilis]|eukprot:MONOS_8486.1-p1 / transcript=MONOS_8486.1 / gene=MONOS_8486 / organism=Monocercomonoides_exilis_PA203 / gene_product=unspecified product / transcript_product=unspecified product / location=Mono_scaffold00321:5234-5791(-) / protein_length=186 / sequence_SO=supercontig / SO=protein_coding / is_pseudo=false